MRGRREGFRKFRYLSNCYGGKQIPCGDDRKKSNDKSKSRGKQKQIPCGDDKQEKQEL
jgi:hypothetical protein